MVNNEYAAYDGEHGARRHCATDQSTEQYYGTLNSTYTPWRSKSGIGLRKSKHEDRDATSKISTTWVCTLLSSVMSSHDVDFVDNTLICATKHSIHLLPLS